MAWYVFALLSGSIVPVSAQQTIGLFINDSLATEGYVLFGNAKQTYLIDACGAIVNSWESDYDPGLSMYLLEDGTLLRTAKESGSFSGGGIGGRIERFSWEGELLWTGSFANEDYHAHHDIAPLPNGHILVLVWEKRSETEAQNAGWKFGGSLYSERILEIEMPGENEMNIIWEWRLWDHLVQDQDAGLPNYGNIGANPMKIDINFPGPPTGEPFALAHLNAVSYHAELDQIAVSSRNYNEVWLIDHNTTSAEAATSQGDLLYRYGNPQVYQRGSAAEQVLFQQHDVRWTAEGNLMVFNNNREPTASSISMWNPEPKPDGTYELNPGQAFGPPIPEEIYQAPGFYSEIMSGAHPIGSNYFICEGNSGRMFEIDADQQIVWEYVNPVNKYSGPMAQGATARYNELFRATKYPANYPAFSGKDMSGGLPVEINPTEMDCETLYIQNQAYYDASDIRILGNPVSDILLIESDIPDQIIHFSLYDLRGRSVQEYWLQKGINQIQLAPGLSGMFIMEFTDNKWLYFIEKLVVLP
ncbi:MAG: aryl-sulfate sulfotransferase [Saprospiraceae bacterium]|nr:aryl-sulfate sulfotransferase [Saprospiraceae bacterium]